MEPTLDRRNDRSDRVPVRIAVELVQGDHRDAFEADALNVSRGGISMRATCLPDVRTQLSCRFECMGTTVSAQGEVVWAHLDGDHSGEFGLAFIDLDPKTEWLIEEMIAEHAVRSPGSGVEQEPSAPVATLELEGSSEPIAARMAKKEDGKAVFEQQLDLLSLGRGVLARAPGAEGRSGSIAAVELRMVGNVPMLAVTVAFDTTSEYGEFSWNGAQPAPEPGHDTEPDLSTPAPSRAARVTITEFNVGDESSPPALHESATQREAEAAEPPAWALSPLEHARADFKHESDREFSHSFALESGGDPELDAELEAFAGPSWQPMVSAALRKLRRHALAAAALLSAVSSAAARRALPKLRGTLLRASSLLRTTYARRLGPQLGAAKRLVLTQFPGRRRRTTTAPFAQKPARSTSLGRTVVLGLLGAGAAGLAAYALVPTGHGDAVELHRRVQPAPAPAQAGTEPAAPSVAPAAPAESPANAKSTSAPEPNHAAKPAPAPSAAPVAVPTAERVPATSPFAVDLRPTPTAPKQEPARKLRFGSAQVPNGHRFALRMSARIQSFQGTPDKGGFTLIVPGCLSLDRAGPISSAVKSVQRAMVVNKGDHAELSIRFADGKQPAYQVSADGTTLYLVIQDL